jgi:hypothetical protein
MVVGEKNGQRLTVIRPFTAFACPNLFLLAKSPSLASELRPAEFNDFVPAVSLIAQKDFTI